MSKQIKDISFLTMASKVHTKSKESLKLNSHWKVSVTPKKKNRARQSTFNSCHNSTWYYKHIQAHQRVQTVVETTATTPRDGFAIVFTFNDVMSPSRSLFYLRFVFLVVSARLSSLHAINKLDNSPQHRDILCNAKQLNAQLEHLMFCKDVCTLYHATFRRAISRNHSTLRWAISRNATPFVCTLYHSPLRWPMSRNATLEFYHCL